MSIDIEEIIMKKYLIPIAALCLLLMAGTAQAADFFELCKTGTAEDVRQALEAGADVNARDDEGYTPLMLAVGGKRGVNKPNSDPEVVRLLIRAGADVRAEFVDYAMDREKYTVNTITALHWAVMRCPEVISDLLDAGADINAPAFFFGTPLMNAMVRSREHPEAVSLLLQRGADPNIECRPFGTALSVALTMGGVALDAVWALIDAGAEIRYVDPYGATMLICAVMGVARNSQEIVRMMLDAGIDVNAADEAGGTAFLAAVRADASLEILQLLLDAGADVNASDNLGTTPLMAAAFGSDPDQVKLLLDAGADAGVRNSRGDTAYGIAARSYRGPGADMIFVRGNTMLLAAVHGLYILLLLTPLGIAIEWIYTRRVLKRPLCWGLFISPLLIFATALMLEFGFNTAVSWIGGGRALPVPLELPTFFKFFFLLPQVLQMLYIRWWDPLGENKKPPRSHLFLSLTIAFLCLALSAAAMGVWSTGASDEPGKFIRKKKA